jgi:PTH1 family peptidyl-tRNA hydrolase
MTVAKPEPKPLPPEVPIRAIVALGNPGKKYAETRHNVGWMALDRLVGDRLAGPVQWQQKFNGEFAKAWIAEKEVLLLKPGTFMNLSGHPTQAMCAFFGVKPEEVLVLHDDLDLAFGRVQVKSGGGHGGHNGLKSLHAQLASNAYARVRLGIGRPDPGKGEVVDWVLMPFAPIERAELPQVLDRARDAVEACLRLGVRAAMNKVNGTVLSGQNGTPTPK